MPAHLLHVFSTFAVGGPQVRTATIINVLGDEFRHTILPMDGRHDALAKISIPVNCIAPPASRHPLVRPLQLRRVLGMLHPDLVLTYNWGAIESVLAARTLSMPVIHTEDGFGPEEAGQLLARRVWSRRLVLGGTQVRTVVPSRTLERIALEKYRLPASRVSYVPNGIDLKRFRSGRSPETRERLGIADQDMVFGTVGGLRPEKDLGFLIRAFLEAAIPNSRLVLVGDGPCRPALEQAAREFGLGSRVCFAGAAEDPVEYYRAFDVFVMTSLTEQMPLALLEAMASGLPAICTDTGDTSLLLASQRAPELLRVGDLDGYQLAMRQLANNGVIRRKLGEKNRARCEAEHGLQKMVGRYQALYSEMVMSSGQ
jgi:glycosyltransferase involved in cell wall biosynthesis